MNMCQSKKLVFSKNLRFTQKLAFSDFEGTLLFAQAYPCLLPST